MTYLIEIPNTIIGITVEDDVVTTAPPVLSWARGRLFTKVRDICKQHGWTIEPVLDEHRPQYLEYDGVEYELEWKGKRIVNIVRNDENGRQDIKYDDLPSVLKRLL